MEYDIKLYDYFETKNKIAGFITSCLNYYSECAKENAIYITGKTTMDKDLEIDVVCSDLHKYFNRIGKYDFSKMHCTKKNTESQLNVITTKLNEIIKIINGINCS